MLGFASGALPGAVAKWLSVDGDQQVGVVAQVLDHFLEAPQAAGAGTHRQLERLVLLLQLFGFLLDVRQDHPDELHDGQDERTECRLPYPHTYTDTCPLFKSVRVRKCQDACTDTLTRDMTAHE